MPTEPRPTHFRSPPEAPGRSSDVMRSLFTAHPVPTWLCEGANLRLIDANDSAVRRYGYSPAQFRAMTMADLERPEDARRPLALRGLAADADGKGEIRRHRKADGTTIAVRIEMCRVEVDGRPAVLVTAIDIDVHERALFDSEQRFDELRCREQRFREMFEAASDWFWETDENGRLAYISPNLETLYRISVADLLGQRLNDIPGIKISPEVAHGALAAIKARQPYRDYVYSWQLSPAEPKRWVHTNSLPMFDRQGDFRGYRGVCRDITAQVEADHALRESEQRFRQLFEIGADYSWEMGADYRMSYVSPNYEAVVGVPASQALGKRFAETPGVRVEPEMGKMAILAQKEKKPYRDFVYSRKLASGEIRWFSVSAVPIFGEDGEFRGFRGVAANITARIKSEAAARLAQRRLHDAVAHVTQPFVVFDADDRAVAFNQAFVDLHTLPDSNTPVCAGVSFRDLAEWQLRTGFYVAGSDEQPTDLETLLARHQSEEEHSYHLRDNRWMLITYRRLPGDGKVGLWTDITAIKRAGEQHRRLEEQLHHSQRLESLGTLAGGVAHELNNTLVPVVALTKIVQRRLPEGSRERANLETVVQASERARDLVKQILAFSRKQELRQETFDLAAVAVEALSMLRASIPSSIRLEPRLSPTPPIQGDPVQLHQMIVNLVTNAAQAIGLAQGTITVVLAAEADEAHLRLSVSDTGCGMDEATRARIFEPFFTTKAVGQGTGLGLAVVHGIVASHGGHIDVHSAPDRGTRVDIVFPIAAVAAADAMA
jgi:PAS domain S-box-containing protein